MRASPVVALLVAVLSISTAASNDEQMMETHLGTKVPTRKVKVYQFMLPEKNIWTISRGKKKNMHRRTIYKLVCGIADRL